jgi:hypothetical protein
LLTALDRISTKLKAFAGRRWTMAAHEHESVGRGLVRELGWAAVHMAAIVVGVILMIAGIGLGVGLVTLPVAIPVGFAGLFVFLWGLFGRSSEETSSQPPTPP